MAFMCEGALPSCPSDAQMGSGPSVSRVFPVFQAFHSLMGKAHVTDNRRATSTFQSAILPPLSQFIFNTKISLVTTTEGQVFLPPHRPGL